MTIKWGRNALSDCLSWCATTAGVSKKALNKKALKRNSKSEIDKLEIAGKQAVQLQKAVCK
ncbi:hypothetical protein D0T90_06065 [Neisseria animalis]|uniref:Uncharacterized protein n=1 Tax=Neisseria animalis TaxID=492 RepID=A0A5P3MRF2_NEIAN|nr:hypothetical protein D0T90_06065 [Neisseria animalis]ROW32676.1 hypothetical protein CGZ60_04405 [Neisseria animalis]